MTRKNSDLLERLLATFRVEADEHLTSMSSGLLALEKAPAGAALSRIVETIFRDVHSLKGAARAVNLAHVESVCQSLESIFAALKGAQLDISGPLLDLLHESIGVLGQLLVAEAGPSGASSPLAAALIRRLEEAREAPPADLGATAGPDPVADVVVQTPPAAPGQAPDTVRVSIAKLDAVMHHVEELLAPRLAASQRAQELRETAATLAAWKKQRQLLQPTLRQIERTLSQDPRRAKQAAGNGGNDPMRGKRELPKLLEYLDAEQLQMKLLEDRLARLSQSAEHDQRMLVGMTDGLLHDVKEMQLLPFSSLLEILPRFVRELAREQDKDVELVVQGGEIEIDRRILDAMKDPLIHLLRNGIDHGIERPAIREARGKPPRGVIGLSISQRDGGKVEVAVTDDGAGIDSDLVRAAAGRLGGLAAEETERLSEQDALSLVFRSGVTTSPIITDVSGRGLGLAIVHERVERLGGNIAIESIPAAGTTFRIVLPLVLANFRGVVVRAGGQQFVVPAANIERVMRVPGQDVRTVENRETILLDGEAVSLVWLGDVLEIPRPPALAGQESRALVIVLGVSRMRIAFRVEEIHGEQEVLVKALGRQLARVRNVAGASVLGTGQVVPVLNVPDLMKSAMKHATRAPGPAPASPAEGTGGAAKRSILVVEDSITSRSLLTGILESAGYDVAAAVDGVDGYTALKTGAFDLLVSDVEMPRMDGFDLTAKVRADKQLSQLPVVLVTALGSREHRERGVDVGANAYIVKSSFDQGNLLEVIRRLL